jgi:hypothetical protein
VGGTNRPILRGHQRLARPDPRNGKHSVCQGLAKHDDIGNDVVVLDGPQPTSTEDSHLYLIGNKENAMPIEYFFQALEIFGRCGNVATSTQDRFCHKGAALGNARAVVLPGSFTFEQAFKLGNAEVVAGLRFSAVRAAVTIRKRHKVR